MSDGWRDDRRVELDGREVPAATGGALQVREDGWRPADALPLHSLRGHARRPRGAPPHGPPLLQPPEGELQHQVTFLQFFLKVITVETEYRVAFVQKEHYCI